MEDNIQSAQFPTETDTQYSLPKILLIWAVVSLPMLVLVFFVAHALVPYTDVHPFLLIWYVGIVGMAWQFVVSMFLLYRELDEFTWSAIKTRTWLNKPSDPKTGNKRYKLFWWLIPAAIFIMFFEFSPAGDYLDQMMLSIFPSLADLEGTNMDKLFIPELVGAWWLLGIAVLNNIFNYFLGEELLFRGILLPKMRGVFGKWDWVANAALFGLYHLDRPQNIPKNRIQRTGFDMDIPSFQKQLVRHHTAWRRRPDRLWWSLFDRVRHGARMNFRLPTRWRNDVAN